MRAQPSGSPSTAWPLVRRSVELERLVGAARRGGNVLVAGPPGIGKSRLLEAARDAARAAGVDVHWVVATSSTARLPFAAVAHLLPEGADTGHVSGLFTLVAAHLAGSPGHRRVAVAVDDGHLLDHGSRALLQHLALHTQVGVVATLRTSQDLEEAKQWAGFELLDLPLLDADAVAEVVTATLRGPVESSLLSTLAEWSGGNPMLLRELMATGLASGAIARRDGLWQRAGALLAPTGLPSAVRARLDRLHPAVRAAAELVAHGEPIGAREIEQLLTPRRIAALDAEGLLAAIPDDRRRQIRLVHPLYAEALRAATPPMRARQHQRRLAAALEATGMRRHGDRLRVGVWRLEAGWRDRPDLLLAAAREASAAFDHPLAAALAEAAVDAGGGFEAELSLLHELPYQGKAEEAAGRADRLAAAAKDEASRIGVAELRARLQLVLGRTDRAHAILAEAILSASDPQDQDRLRGQQVSLAYSVGDIARAVAIGTSVVGRADARPTATAVYYVVRSMACAGRGEDALVIADRWLEPPSGPSGPAPTRYVAMARLQAMALSGRVADAVAVAEREVLEAMHGPKAATRPFWMHDLAHATLLAGRIGAARRRFLEVLSLMPLDGLPPSGRLWVLDGLAEAAALSGDTADAGGYVARLDEATPPWCTPLKRSGTIWEAAARGEITRARTLAVRYAARFEELGATMMRVWVLHDAMRLGAGRDVAEDLAASAALCQGPLPALMATNAQALAGGDADALDVVAGRFAELGYVLLAAESASEAARRYRAAGRPGRAASASLRARGWKELTDGARTPLLDAPVGSIGLTAREHEVAAMAATGLSDRDIAGRLQLSIRTVQSHLYRTYQKLGIPDRTELARLFEPGERNSP